MSCFKARCGELQSIGREVIKLDATRRSRMKEILLSFIPRRRRLFLKTAEACDPAVTSLENAQDKRQERRDIETALDDMLEKLSERCASGKKERRASVGKTSSRTIKQLDLLFSPSTEVNNLQARSPFESMHVRELKAVEVKSGAKSSWRLALTVITEDSFMHILPCSLKRGDLQGDDFKKKPERLMASKLTGVVPSLSFALSTCAMSMPPAAEEENRIDFSLPSDSRMLSMRLSNRNATLDWYEAHKGGC